MTLLAIIAVPWFWDRWKRKLLWRTATVLLAVVLLVVTTGMAGNMIGGFFPTVGSLLGTGVYAARAPTRRPRKTARTSRSCATRAWRTPERAREPSST